MKSNRPPATPSSLSNRPMASGKRAAAARAKRPDRPDLSPAPKAVNAKAHEAHRRVDQYRPETATVSKTTWEQIAAPVRDIGHQLVDAGQHGDITNLVRVTAQLAAWCHGRGVPLTVNNLYSPNNIDVFVDKQLAGMRRAGTYRSHLRRAARCLNPKAWQKERRVGGRTVARPYTAEEVAGYLRMCERQATPRRRQKLRTILVLGLGCGLDARWAIWVRPEDVRYKDGVLGVDTVEPSPRFVPVLAQYEDELRRVAADYAASPTLFGAPSSARSYASDSIRKVAIPSGLPHLDYGRLRATWVVHHLTIGTRTPELAEAAGVQGLVTFSDMLVFVPLLDPDRSVARVAALRMLRGEQ